MKQAKIYLYDIFAGVLTEDEKAIENIYTRYEKVLPEWYAFIDTSFLPDDMKASYKGLIKRRAEILLSITNHGGN